MAWKTPRQYPGPSTPQRVASKSGAMPLRRQPAGTAIEDFKYGNERPMAAFISRPQTGAGIKYKDAVKVDVPRTSWRYKTVSCSLALRVPQTRNTVIQTAVKVWSKASLESAPGD